MNLHGIVAPYIGTVNPLIPIEVRVSAGYSTASDGKQVPTYATPGAFTGSIANGVLTVSVVASGVLLPLQTIAGTDIPAQTSIVEQLSGTDGGAGTYRLSALIESVASEAMTSTLVLPGQVQPMTWRDLQQLQGVNQGGVKWKVYLNGKIDAVVRAEGMGGDLVIISAPSPHAGTWLVTQLLEQFPDWACAAIVLQDD